MKKWLHDFFSVSNEINENIVIGVLFVLVFIPCIFLDFVPDAKLYTLAVLIASFFGLGALKK